MTVAISGRSIRVTANGLRHHLLVYGEGVGREVLMLPGITSPAAAADFIAKALSNEGFRIFVPDLRGRGQTDVAPAGSYRLTDYAADAHELIGALGLARPAVVGHSLGARIAAAYAVLHAPIDHGPLVLVDPPVSGPGRGPYPTTRESFLAQLREAKQGTSAAQVRRYYPKWPERELQIRAEVLASCDETAVLETHAGFESEDFFPYWEKITRPATLIRGANSPVVSSQDAADLARTNPTIPIVCISDSGHMVPWDNFGEFFRCLVPLLTPAQKR